MNLDDAPTANSGWYFFRPSSLPSSSSAIQVKRAKEKKKEWYLFEKNPNPKKKHPTKGKVKEKAKGIQTVIKGSKIKT